MIKSEKENNPFCDTPSLLSSDDNVLQLEKNISKLHIFEGLPEWACTTESPFTWQPKKFEDVNSDQVIALAKEKAEYDDLFFDKFARMLTLVYEYRHVNNFEEARSMIGSAENLLDQEKEAKKSSKIMNALEHVLQASYVHILASQGFEDESKEEYEKIIPLSTMSAGEKAAIHALKAKFFSLYRKKGFEKAVEYSRKALELDPDEPMWMFLLAESMRREKKYFPSNEIPKEELQLLERAVATDRNPRYMVYLAHKYIFCAKMAVKNYRHNDGFHNSGLKEMAEKMNDEAVKLFQEALELDPENELINRRCGFGLMAADGKTVRKCKDLIKTVLHKALEISPLSMTLHYLGKYYKQVEGDNVKALEFVEQAAQCDENFPAQCYLLRIKFELYGLDKYDPTEDLENILKRQTQIETHYKHKALSNSGSYQLLIRRDLKKALEYFEIILDENGNQECMTKNIPIFLKTNKTVDLYEVLANEIMKADEEKLPNKKDLIKKITNISPEYFNKPINEHLIDNIITNINMPIYPKEQENWRKSNKSENSRFTEQRQSYTKKESFTESENRFSKYSSNNFQNRGRNTNHSSQYPRRGQASWRQEAEGSSQDSNWRQRKPSVQE